VDSSFRLKHYRLNRTKPIDQPALLFEIDLELQDVRSKYRDSYRAFFQAEWLRASDLSWTPDMVCQIRPDWLVEIPPPSEFEWPAWSDSKIVHYLTHHFRPRIWRNQSLGMYSHPGESKEEFLLRCRDQVFEEWLEEQKKFWDIFVHRFLELEEKLIKEMEGEREEDEEFSDLRLERVKDLLFSVRESLWAFRDCWQPGDVPSLDWKSETVPAVQGRLDDLRQDLVTMCERINRGYQQEARQIERYEVPVPYLQMEVVSRGIMWSSIASESDRTGEP